MDDVVKYKALLGLAQADGEFDNTEKEFIRTLAKKQGLTVNGLKMVLSNKGRLNRKIQNLSFDDKVDILTLLVKLMKVDGKVLLSEIKYCEKVARKFGFDEKAIGFLSGILESDLHIDPNFGRIKYRMRKYVRQAA